MKVGQNFSVLNLIKDLSHILVIFIQKVSLKITIGFQDLQIMLEIISKERGFDCSASFYDKLLEFSNSKIK